MTHIQIPYMATRQELHEASLRRPSQDALALPPELEVRLHEERGLWSVALENSEAETARALQSLSEHVQRQVLDAADISARVEAQLAGLESRLSMALSDLDVRQQAERTERGADLVAVRQDLDRQWEELSKGLAAAVAETDARAEKDKRALLDALAAVCSDIEALRTQQKELSLEKALESCRELQEPLQAAATSLRGEVTRTVGEVQELQQQQARLRSSMEQSLREELESFVMEELRVRKLNELEILQKEDSRHRADIDALREKQNMALEALRSEEAVRREALETQCLGEVQTLRQQLQQLQQQQQLQLPRLPPPPADEDAVFERLLQELQEECGQLAERLGEDVAQLRAQLAQALGEVRTAQGKQDAAMQVLRTTWENRWEELQALQAKESELESPKGAEPVSGAAELQALAQRHESHALEVKSRFSMYSREIQELQRQLLDALRDLGSAKRASAEVQALREEHQRDLTSLMDLAKRDGEWSIFKAFGCKADRTASDREDPLERQVRQASAATPEDLELLRSKQRQEVLQLQTQQRSFFDEVLDQQGSHQQHLAGEIEALRSHCDAAVAAVHSEQSKSLEAMRQQQRRMQQIQGQLLGDVGSLKNQVVEGIRRSARTEEMAETQHVAV